jgi:two-component system, OmpR family, phosphate regulon sensor histidine kinase PhoR
VDAAHLRRLLDAAPDPVLVVDADDVVQDASRQVRGLLGRPAAELVGRRLADVVRDRPLALSRVQVEPGLTGVYLRDISSRLQLEAENDRLRDELIANISHELQTPLTSIIGYAELLGELDDDELGPQARRLVDVIRRNAQRELRLVDDLLAVSFHDQSLARMASEPLDLHALAAQVVEERQPFADGAGLALRLAPGPASYVRGDGHHLGRLVEHLVVNACKFSPPGARVDLRVATEETAVVLTVADTGIGVSDEEAARLFERLYRAPGAIDRHVEGAGLGLAIAKAVTEAHGGSIRLDSTLGAGTTVTVRLPAVTP